VSTVEQLVAERDRQALVCCVLVSQAHWDQAAERAQIVSNLTAAVVRLAEASLVTEKAPALR
jgi:hypothetical protein